MLNKQVFTRFDHRFPLHVARLVRPWFGCLACLFLLFLSCGCVFDDETGGGAACFRRTMSRFSGFDPVHSPDVYSAKSAALIYECLLQYSYLDRPYRVEPCLARELPEISEDGLDIVFRLREGIFFSDNKCFPGGRGRKMTAEDIVYSLKRLADIKNASPGYWLLSDRIEGLDDFRDASRGEDPTDYGMPVSGLRATGRYILKIRLKRPYPQLLWALTMVYTAVVPREAVEYYGTEFLNNPVGTGPYVLGEWRRGHKLVFERNPKWRETGRIEKMPVLDRGGAITTAVGGGGPALDRIVFYDIEDSSTRWLAFMSGMLDMNPEISRDHWDVVMSVDLNLAADLAARGIRLAAMPALDVAYIGFNMDDPVVGGNADLRRALSCAFNSREWIEFYNNRIVRASGPLPPGISGHDEPQPYPFDLERASALLAAAGYPGGIDPATGRRLQLTLEAGRTDQQTRESTELFASFMERIGVVIKAEYSNWPSFLSRLERRQAQMFRIAWLADYPDAENFLQLFYGPNASPGPNRSNYLNHDYDRLFESARVMRDSPERDALYSRMIDIVRNDAPWIFMHHQVNYSLYHERLVNYVPHDFPYGMERYYIIDDSKAGRAGAD